MAETVYLNDGSVEVVFGSRQEFFERLIREKLGDDAARFFRDTVSELNEQIKADADAIREEEGATDFYSSLCHDAMDSFAEICNILNRKPLDMTRLKKVAEEGYKDLHNNL